MRSETSTQMVKIQEKHNNIEVTKYFSATNMILKRSDGSDLSNDNTPWCSAFVNWCLLKAGYLGTRNAAAISWDQSKWGDVLDEPRYGAIAVIKQGGGHHVGFYVSTVKIKESSRIVMLGGNQGHPGRVNETIICTLADVVSYHWPTENNKL